MDGINKVKVNAFVKDGIIIQVSDRLRVDIRNCDCCEGKDVCVLENLIPPLQEAIYFQGLDGSYVGGTWDGTTATAFDTSESDARNDSWDTAKASYVTSGMTDSIKWKRAVKSNRRDLMIDADWALLQDEF